LTSQFKGGQRIRIEVQAPEQGLRDLLAQLPGASRIALEPVRSDGHLGVTVEAAQGADIRSQIAAKIVEKGWPLYELRGVSLSLEEIFLELTTDDATHAQASS
jgi:ABC-2 type transport system ATP-binding protein